MQDHEPRAPSKSERTAQGPRFWARSRRTFVFAASAFMELVLWGAGYPIWRLTAIGMLFAALAGFFNLADSGLIDRAATLASAEHRQQSSTTYRLGWVFSLGLAILIVGLTGGLRSPMLAGVPAILAVIAVRYGWSRITQVAGTLMIAAMLAMAWLPPAWLGPEMPAFSFALLAVATVIGAGTFGFGHIITLMDYLELNRYALHRAREQLLAQTYTRARELEQMGAQLSHELKNPLQAIGILVQLSARDACEPEARERLQVAKAEVERMDSIIKGYLSFSRPFDKLQPKKVALGAAADEVLAVLEAGASAAGVVLRRTGDAQVEADPRRIREALHYLVSNAIEACSRGRIVEVEISQRDDRVRIAVRDSGHGMSRDVLQRLGTAFFTTRSEGTGLGVAMARAAFIQHGGELIYESEQGRGTTAIGILPLQPQQRRDDGARTVG